MNQILFWREKSKSFELFIVSRICQFSRRWKLRFTSEKFTPDWPID